MPMTKEKTEYWSIDCNEKALNYSTSVPLGLAIKEI